jgi:hypothetical protein
MAVLTHFDDQFNETIRRLVNDQNLLRIKKLLVYTCRNSWESDLVRLNHYDLRELVRELIAIAPTLDQLKQRLDLVVKTINKPAEYTLIANAVVNHLKKLYTDAPQLFESNLDHAACLEVVQSFKQDQDYLRIKKVLYCACRHTWENNLSKLTQVNIFNLVQELFQLAPQQADLDAILQRIVSTLNRQDEYQAIAEKISQAFHHLYQTPHDEAQEQTHIINHAVDRLGASYPAVAAPNQPTSALKPTHSTNNTALTPPPQPNNQPSSHPIPQYNDLRSFTPFAAPVTSVDPVLDAEGLPDSGPPANVVRRSLDPSKLFDLRIEIMKFTNPLRAKILMLTTLHPSTPVHVQVHQMYQTLNRYQLDELLQELFQSYKALPELAVDLKQAAQQLPETDQYLQSAETVVRALRPIYEMSIVFPGE